MFDNIHFYIDNYTAKSNNLLSDILQNGDDINIEKYGKTSNEIPYAYFSILGDKDQQLNFMVTPYILKMTGKNSSICKFHFGNNFETLSLSQFRETIDYISERLGVNIKEANVCRIDISTNFLMTYIPSTYHTCLIDLPRFQKVNYGTNIYFQTRKIELNFYDKKKEYKQKGVPIPEKFRDLKNVLRYEIRFKKNIAKTFKRTIKVNDLYDEVFFNILIEKWKEKYWSIKKQNPIALKSCSGTYKTADFRNYYMLAGMESNGGLKHVYQTIKSNKESGVISKDQASYLKRIAYNTYNSFSNSTNQTYDFVNELDEKMRTYIPIY